MAPRTVTEIKGIVLCGLPGSGKTTIADEIAALMGWERRSFADPLKTEVANALAYTHSSGLDLATIHRELMQHPGRKDKYRPLLQAWGSFFRASEPDYWVKKLRSTLGVTGKYVIDDCRYDNEYRMLRDAGFVFVLLEPGPTHRPFGSEAEADHESERDWPVFGFDVLLDYEPGPRLQAVRILQKLGIPIPQPAGGVYIEDALPEDTQDCEQECRCGDTAPENCYCGECANGVEVLTEHAAGTVHNFASLLVKWDPPLTIRNGQRIVFTSPYIEEAEAEPVWAVPA